MEVPEMILNFTLLVSEAKGLGPAAPVQAARMFTPGAVISGFKTLEFRGFGPREEKDAIAGAGVTPSFVPLKESFAVGAGVDVLFYTGERSHWISKLVIVSVIVLCVTTLRFRVWAVVIDFDCDF